MQSEGKHISLQPRVGLRSLSDKNRNTDAENEQRHVKWGPSEDLGDHELDELAKDVSDMSWWRILLAS